MWVGQIFVRMVLVCEVFCGLPSQACPTIPDKIDGTLLGRSLKSPLPWINVENIDLGSHDEHMEGSTIASGEMEGVIHG